MSASETPHTRMAVLPQFVERTDLVASFLAMGLHGGVHGGQVRMGTIGRCQVIAAQERVGPDWRWHLSISHPFRLPTWDEINAARDAVVPADVWLCQPMPPRDFWVNVDHHCLHLWEVRDRSLLEQWAFDGCMDEAKAVAVVDAFLSAANEKSFSPT